MNEEKEITKILMELGTPCHLAGYDLIRQAVVIMLSNEKIKQTDVYRQLAENVGKTQSQVERNIRHAIEVTFNNIRPETVKKYFGNTVDYNGVKPCNAQFLATIAEHVKNKELYTE